MGRYTKEELTDKLFNAISTIIESKLSMLPIDKYIVVEIMNIDRGQYGEYLARLSNQTSMTVYSDNPDLQIGDRVYVRVPGGDYTQHKVVTGYYVEANRQTPLRRKE